VSRTDPRLLIKLFENEVPEIHDGTVIIQNCVREAGDRAKVAVQSVDSDVDPVGACVGLKGSRVQAIIRELKNEKIDIVRYDEDPLRFIANALNPAKALRVTVVDPDNRRVEVVVDDEQLSIAIGKRGQNVRLAAKLTGWNIDVRSEADKRRENEVALGAALGDTPAETAAEAETAPSSTLLSEIGALEGLTPEVADRLAEAGYGSAKSLYTVTAEQLLQVEGLDQELAFRLMDAVHALFGE
jgi:N utilization substance protein A